MLASISAGSDESIKPLFNITGMIGICLFIGGSVGVLLLSFFEELLSFGSVS